MSTDNKYMIGSTGNADYLVIAEKDDHRLGVKGISSGGPAGTMLIGMRIRTQRKDGQPIETPKDFGDIWPLPFEQFNEFRASYETIQFLNLSAFQMERITADPFSILGNGAWDYFENSGVELNIERDQFCPVMMKYWFEGYEKLLNENDLKFLLSGFTNASKVMKNIKDKGIEIQQNNVMVKGEAKPWPALKKGKVDKPKKKNKTRKRVQGAKGKAKKETANNVVPIKPKK